MGNWGGLWVGVMRIAEFCGGGEGGEEFNIQEGTLKEGEAVVIQNGRFCLGGSGRTVAGEEDLPPVAAAAISLSEITPVDVDVDAPSSQIQTSSFVMDNVNLTLHTSTFTGIIGPVASGKTTLIRSIVGSVKSSSGQVNLWKGGTGYASQTAFILNSTVKDNILFGEDFDQERYDKCVWCCNLKKDFEQFPAGDMSELGERGVTLSGGQKARVGVCRALYKTESKVIALDDPLSALDAETGKLVFDRIRNCSLFKGKAVAVVTNAGWVCRSFDRLLLTYAGAIRFDGSWDELAKFECDDAELAAFVKSIVETAQVKSDKKRKKKQGKGEGEEAGEEKKKDVLIMDEVAEEVRVCEERSEAMS